MLDVMYTHDGIGIAAPQVGSNLNVIIIDASSGEDAKKCCVMVNPLLLEKSITSSIAIEGCLSLPNQDFKIKRATRLQASWQDLAGKEHVSWLVDLEARIFLHELDHLSGLLISDIGERVTLTSREDR